MNLLGPELVRDLVSLIQTAEAEEAFRVLVFNSADPDYFISHVDVTRIKEYREEAAKLTGDASLALLFRRLSTSRLVTIARSRAARAPPVASLCSPAICALPPRNQRFSGSSSRPSARPRARAPFSISPALMGRGRALELMLSAQDYDAELAERYGWINRALPAAALGDFVRSLAFRITSFRLAAALQSRIGSTQSRSRRWDFGQDSDLFGDSVQGSDAQGRIRVATTRGFQTREGEMTLARMLGELAR